MARTRQKDLVLILSRELAEHIVSPVLIVDEKGTLVFYNERAGEILGTRFEDAGELPASKWAAMWQPEDPEKGAVPLEDLPLAIAVAQQRPAHRPLRITGLDGVRRDIGVTAFPLFSREKRFVGAIAIFWQTE